MKVKLKELKNNPYRDFSIDPLDEERIDELRKSINEDGFWGGAALVARGNDILVAAGRTRIEAAIREGIKEAELYVGTDIDDAKMIRIYARENATQRGGNSVSHVGSVASAIRYLAKTAMSNPTEDDTGIVDCIARDKGVAAIVSDFFGGVPGINPTSVQQAIGVLKASGNYSRIINEVKDEVEQSNCESIKDLSRIEAEQKKVADDLIKAEAKKDKEEIAKVKKSLQHVQSKIKEREPVRKMQETAIKLKKAADTDSNVRVFDFEGVSEYLKTTNQIDAFCKIVTAKGIAAVLPVDNQAKLAKRLLGMARAQDAELTGTFIKENVVDLYLQSNESQKRIERDEQKRLSQQNKIVRAQEYMRSFSGGCRRMIEYGHRLAKLQKDNPELKFPITQEFRNAVTTAKAVINQLCELL